MQIVPFRAHCQSVCTNFDFSSFSRISCNTILCNYVGTVWWIAIPTVGICNAILGYFVDTGTINRPLRLRGGHGKTWGTINKNNGIAISTMGICNAIWWVFVGTGTINRSPTAADSLPICGCLRIYKYQKIVFTRTLVTCYNTTTYTEYLLLQCKNHTFAM